MFIVFPLVGQSLAITGLQDPYRVIPASKRQSRFLSPEREIPACAGMTLVRLRQLRRDFLAGFDEAFNGADRLFEGLLFGGVERDLDDLFNATGTDDNRNADIGVLDAIFAVEIGGGGQNALLVLEIALGHGDG